MRATTRIIGAATPALQWVPLSHCPTMLVTRRGYDTPAFTALKQQLLASANISAATNS